MRVVSAVLVSLALAGAAAASGATGVPSAQMHVSPAAGGPRTVFSVSFRAPRRTGVQGSMQRFDALSASAPAATAVGGCLTRIDLTLPPAAQSSPVRVRLDAHTHASHWCSGTYHGQVEELERPVCPPGKACPAFVALLGTIGRFSFVVRAAAPPNGTPPSFGGLQRAFACTPGPQRPGQTTFFSLSWQPASDPLVASSQIVYDIYFASVPGGEDFSAPTWTSAPGANVFRTPGLASHSSFYFVVRARDPAGNEDRNTIEVHGSDPCL